MKFRYGFVSNSSSTSFCIGPSKVYPDTYDVGTGFLITKDLKYYSIPGISDCVEIMKQFNLKFVQQKYKDQANDYIVSKLPKHICYVEMKSGMFRPKDNPLDEKETEKWQIIFHYPELPPSWWKDEHSELCQQVLNERLAIEGGCYVAKWTDGGEYHYKCGVFHRDGDLPAYINGDTKKWYKNGKLHRDNDLPAVEEECEEWGFSEGHKEWWVNGVFVRDNDETRYADEY